MCPHPCARSVKASGKRRTFAQYTDSLLTSLLEKDGKEAGLNYPSFLRVGSTAVGCIQQPTGAGGRSCSRFPLISLLPIFMKDYDFQGLRKNIMIIGCCGPIHPSDHCTQYLPTCVAGRGSRVKLRAHRGYVCFAFLCLPPAPTSPRRYIAYAAKLKTQRKTISSESAHRLRNKSSHSSAAVTSSCCDVISCLPLHLKLRNNICRLVYALISWLLCRRKQKHARALTTVVRRDDWR